ncbi:hypothetical protein [Chroococcus sp. FPU101]|uniref:hypothetical protein n=1 Tax=Chroococcus sp. FPU101 TaxID=1974212 RepID=UPI001A8DD822|nr:hypothetical protein [Chroococcus sp. FPU101]GFE72040.1 hypothetical protein CFPU101_46500 [Chroococcus sp. FPU101]
MPDGDIVHSGLRRLYQKPYKWLCEGKATSNECARVVLKKLKQDIKDKGDLPVMLAQSMAEILVQAISAVNKLEAEDYATLSMEFDKLVQQSNGRPGLKELVLRAAKSVLHDFRYGQQVDVGNPSVVILRRYMNEVYESEFRERISLTIEHYAGVARTTLSKRVQEIQPNINIAINKWAKDAINKQSIAKLSLPRRSSRKAIDLNEDLLAGQIL